MTIERTVIDGDRIRAAADRLRLAEQVEEEEREQEGFERGLTWALETAMPRELEAVVSLTEENWPARPSRCPV